MSDPVEAMREAVAHHNSDPRVMTAITAATNAARVAARAADAAYAYAYAAERKWQNNRLLQYLNGEV